MLKFALLLGLLASVNRFVASTTCDDSFGPLRMAGSMQAKVMPVNASQLVSITCQAVCGRISWRINGTTIEETFDTKGEYKIEALSWCSKSTSPDCPLCGCNNCNEAELSQTVTSTLNISANKSVTVECFSHQVYEHQDYILLLREVTLKMMESPMPTSPLSSSSTSSSMMPNSHIGDQTTSPVPVSATGTMSTTIFTPTLSSRRPDVENFAQQALISIFLPCVIAFAIAFMIIIVLVAMVVHYWNKSRKV